MSSAGSGEEDWPELVRATKTIVIVDVVESVRLMQAYESDVIDRWRRFVQEVRVQVLPLHGGRMVKSLGDGMLLEFESVPLAVASAFDMHSRLAAYNLGRPIAAHLRVRTGVHVCEVVRDELDVYGPGVNLAARLAGLAGADEVVASMAVADELIAQVDARIEDMGECWLKHIDQPVHCSKLSPPGFISATVPEHRPAAPALTERIYATIAVITFECRGEFIPDDRVIGELIAEGVIAQLSRSPELQVISHLSTRLLRTRALPMETVASVTGAAYILSGSLFAANEMLLISAELIEVKSGAVIWADRQNCSRAELLLAPSPPLERIANQAHEAILNTEARRALTQPLPTLEGYSLLTGSVGLLHRATASDFQRARDGLELLAERVPRHGAAFAWLAKWHCLRIIRGTTASPQSEKNEAVWRIEQALERDSTSSIAWSLSGLVYGFLGKNLPQADQAYATALQHNPNEPLAWLFTATLRSWQGRGEEAAAAAEKALLLSPLDPMRYYYESLAAAGFLANQQYDRARELCLGSLSLNRSHTPTYRVLAIAQMLAGDGGAARETIQRMLAFEPHLTVGLYLERYPGAGHVHASLYADALREAGLPN